jgi:hypothetical protein
MTQTANIPAADTGKIDRLFNLLPMSYRQRDLEEGSPLQMLLRVIAEQVNLVENDIFQLYDNWFIETCQDWVVPYIADLLGYQPVNPPDPTVTPSAALERVLVPRSEVANTIRFRRRKGTLSLLPDLAVAVSGWPAIVQEFDGKVGVTQALDHLHLSKGRFAELHDPAPLDLVSPSASAAAFDPLSHSVDIREIDSLLSPGRYNTPAVGVLISRLRNYSVTRSLAYSVDEAGDQCYTFSILGNNQPVYTNYQRPHARAATSPPFPVPLRRSALQLEPHESHASHASEAGRPAGADRHEPDHASSHVYGVEHGLAIWTDGWGGFDSKTPIPASRIIPADLTDWRYRPANNHVALDPELGRIAFPPEQLPQGDVYVTYNYAFAADMGGGEYPRPLVYSPSTRIYQVGVGCEFSSIHDASEQWREQKPVNAVIELIDSSVYQEQVHLAIPARHSLELRASSGARPVLLHLDLHATRPDAITVAGESHSRFTLDGVTVVGRGIQVSGELDTLAIRHSTLVPGWSLHPDCTPRRTNEPSLALNNLTANVKIDHSILGGIQIYQQKQDVDPIRLRVANSIIDSTHRQNAFVINAPEDRIAPAAIHFHHCTVIGKVQTHSVILAENSIFIGELRVARRQQGCVRFCYISPSSRTPQRFHCQPDLVEQAAASEAKAQSLSVEDTRSLVRVEGLRVEPQFLSTRYGTPNYCRLADDCAAEITAGADDRSEMGVFHNLYAPQRANNLRTRLFEYTPAACDAGILFVT